MKMFIYLLCSLWLSFAVHAAELKFEPATPIVEVGKEVSLTVSGTTGQITWSAQKGWIVGTSNIISYKAPDQTGIDAVTVLDVAGNIGTVKIQIISKSNISAENAYWEILTDRSQVNDLSLSENDKTLWMGTNGGLEKRDALSGSLQRVFLHVDGLPDNHITTLLIDDHSGLWIGTNKGLAHSRDQEQWTVYNTENSKLPLNEITTLLSDDQGGVWIGTYYYHCYSKDEYGDCDGEEQKSALAHLTAHGEWTVYTSENSKLSEQRISLLLKDGEEGIWTETEGTVVYLNMLGEFTVYPKESSQLPDAYIQLLQNHERDNPWIDNTSGLVHLNKQHDSIAYVRENTGLPDVSLGNLRGDGLGGLWIVDTYNSDVIHIDRQGNQKTFNADKLHNLVMDKFVADRKGRLWFKSIEGLAYLNDQGEKVIYTVENSKLPNKDITNLFGDEQGGLWIGTQAGTFAHLDSQGEWTTYPTQPNVSITTFVNDGQDGVWVGTGSTGLIHLELPNKSTNYSSTNSKLPFDEINALLNDGQGGVWIGGLYTDWTGEEMPKNYIILAHLNDKKKWQSYKKYFGESFIGIGDIESYTIQSLYDDGQGGIWIITNTSISGLDPHNINELVHLNNKGQWKIYSELGPTFHSTLSDGQGGLWIVMTDEATAIADTHTIGKGLAHLDSQERLEIYTKDNSGLPDNLVSQFHSDKQGGWWIVTTEDIYDYYNPILKNGGAGRGLTHLSSQGQWVTYSRENSGLPVDDITSLFVDKQDSLWIGTNDGGLAHLTFQEKQTGKRAAIIIAAGGNHQENTLWDATESITTYIYKMLAARKFVNEEIYYLSSGVGADFNGDGIDDRIIDAPRPQRPLVLDDIRQAFTWAKQHGKLDQPLYVFFMDHGGTEKLLLNKTEYMEAVQLKEILDDYQSTTGSQIVLVIEACYSGSLLPILKAPNRAILTSASANEVANFVEKQGFTRFLTKYLLSGSNFLESYQLAQREQTKLLGKLTQRTVAASGAEVTQGGQSPQLDDNGDGIYDAAQDGQWLKQLKINGDLQTADFTLAVENLTPSSAISVAQELQLKAKVITAKGNVERVWAVIRPPRMNSVLDTNGTPILAFPRENLISSRDEKDIWQVTWNNAIYNGEYEITFYAEDNEKNIAGSEQDAILTVSGGIEPPAQAQVQIQLDKTRYQRGEQFKATLTEDLGWGYDLYAAVVMPDGNYFTLKNTNELRGVKEAKPWYVLRKQGQPITLLDLPLPTNLPTGQYCLYGILSPEQNDVFEAMNKNLWVYGQQCFELF